IIGDNPEALLLSVLYAEAGITNYLVGPFGDDGRTHSNRAGLEEALWLLGIFKKSGKITIAPDHHRLPLSQVRTLILATHASSPFQEELLRVFPTLSLTSTVEIAEASGLFSAVSREVGRALELELAKMSEVHGINYDDVLELSGDGRVAFTGSSNPIPERESIATGIALSS